MTETRNQVVDAHVLNARKYGLQQLVLPDVPFNVCVGVVCPRVLHEIAGGAQPVERCGLQVRHGQFEIGLRDDAIFVAADVVRNCQIFRAFDQFRDIGAGVVRCDAGNAP